MKKISSGLKVDRFRHIVNLVNSRGRVSLAELERELDVSRITIQRDLVELEQRNIIKRFHGGAMSHTFSGKIYNYEVKVGQNVSAKKKIALKASELIRAGDYTALDASSTVHYVSETVFPGSGLVFCCGIDAFKTLSKRDDIQVVLSGGRYDRQTGLVNGIEAVEAVRRFRFDTVFISCESFAGSDGFFDPYEEDVLVKRALIAQAKRVVLLVDASKFNIKSGIKVCDIDDVSVLITDAAITPELKKLFRGRIILAEDE